MVEQQNLDYLREEMQNITNQIIKLVHDRMEVAKKIGNIKQQLKIEIEDEKVEHDIKKIVLLRLRGRGRNTIMEGKP